MDGNIYLIKMIKERPVIWMNNCNSKSGDNKRTHQYEEIAERIGTTSNWIISRWTMLRNKFFREYRTATHKKNYKIRFKYFKNMLFLTNTLRTRNIPDFKTIIYQDKNSCQFISLPDNNPEFVLEETVLKNWTTNDNYFAFNDLKMLNTLNISNDNKNEKNFAHQHNEKQNIESVSELPDSDNKKRCEDIIFGELVTAMLKEMPTNKKKFIKKRIMNIMFS